ncbi:hypothetical protein [Leucobacter luti]|uniref:hypothetical protein n=1 Tax=Leucobacter luti TaxID=340320 RepID=UPI003D08DE7B
MIRVPKCLTATLPIAAIVGAILLSGCAGNTDAERDEVPTGPLQEYLGAIWDQEEMTQEKLDEQHRKMEELTAECMLKEGFEYTPNLATGPQVGNSEEGSSVEWGTAEFAKEYGYGIVESPPLGGDQEGGGGEPPADPNTDYILSLSESEQEAFSEALYGSGPSEEEMAAAEEGEGIEWGLEKAGCSGAAHHAVQSEDASMAAYDDPEFKDLFDSMSSIYSGFYSMTGTEGPSDPEAVKLDREWADCMSEAGHHDLTSPSTTQSAMSEEFYETSGMPSATGEFAEPSDEVKAKFKQREIAVATADSECREKLGYDDKLQKLVFAAEQKFIDENKARLDALIAKYGKDSKAK